MQTKFSPIMHPTLHDHHRVPIVYCNGKYEVFVGDDHVRILDENELPDVIKSRLAMVKASVINPLNEDPYLIAKAYDCPPDSPLFEIGWQPCEGLFVVVIPTKDLTYLRGKSYDVSFRHVEAIGFIADDRPSFRTLETYIAWRRLKQRSKQK